LTSGIVWAWGRNTTGQLGIGNTQNQARANRVIKSNGNDLTDIRAIAAGISHSLALTNSKMVWGWGADTSGQVGDAAASGAVRYPVLVQAQTATGGATTLQLVKAVAAGDVHSLALCEDGTVYAWGSNVSGELGMGSVGGVQEVAKQVRITPTTILSGVARIAAGSSHSVAQLTNGLVYAWGNNANGQLGNGAVGGVSAYATLLPDSDADTLDDSWEVSTFGSVFQETGDTDYDRDGISNGAELDLGWDPLTNDLNHAGKTETLVYDGASRIIQVTGRSALNYSIDPAGNLTQAQ
jgi:alpha-tubulin suppressor-like RCC1 family protein